ncbi:hypothetical protein JAAARDRAFT_32876 [Jaapia argillacea MUCL 33604]|uniref:DUF6533 domain-containing protein n=1 Tax=Jaapia argillacea MUCL 33604 TaxID=933084 RepID=A0A067QD03_9AGAM|nr:hypothetical protein JAAARDRAFT_32876 [Jaapia argillacea MUCL 33604]
MSADPNPLDTWKHAQWERFCQLSAATLITYEFIIQFGNEVELFWKKRWSVGKALFLWSRYYSLCFNIGNAVVFMHKPTLDICGNFFHWQNAGATLQLLTTHIILMLRLYAMYQGDKRVLAFMVILLFGEAATMGVFIGVNKPGLVGTNEPIPGLLICADGDPPGEHWIAYYFTAILTIEFALLALSLNKAWRHYRTGSGGGVMALLTRDSVLYFLAMFWTYVLNQVIWLMNRITLNELATGFSFSICAVLANRLMINVRESYYSGNAPEVVEFEIGESRPVRFRRTRATTISRNTNFELETFDHRRGY